MNFQLARLKLTHRLVFKKVCAEANSINQLKTLGFSIGLLRLDLLTRKYAPDNIVNADETAIFYNALSDKT